MDRAQLHSITDVDVLRRLLIEQTRMLDERDQQLASREQTIVRKDSLIEQFKREIARLKRLQFSPTAERLDPAQRELFQQTMSADIAAVEAQLEAVQAEDEEMVSVPRLRTPVRRPLPEHLERIETRHEPDACACPQCLAELVHIGDQVSEKLACKPLEFYVRRDVYPQYACRACEQVIAQPVAPAIIERGQADASLLAQVVVAKYVDHLPLYRQQAIYARSGVELSRSTLAEWIGAIGVALQPLADRLTARLHEQPVLHADETPVAMLEPGAGKTRRSYLFAYASVRHPGADPPMVVFDFQTNRSGAHARQFLGSWRGSLMVDDYAGYKALFASGVTELGCWAHARRKFFELQAASGSAIATEALVRIGQLYQIEQAAAAMRVALRHDYRQQHAVPVLTALKAWLEQTRAQVAGNSGTARAVDYTLRRWEALARYVDDGAYPIDNNPIENAIRPVALGRKNWLFAGSEQAGRRAAAIMSLLATAKTNGLDPHAWLSDTLARLPRTLHRDIDRLLPLPAAADAKA